MNRNIFPLYKPKWYCINSRQEHRWILMILHKNTIRTPPHWMFSSVCVFHAIIYCKCWIQNENYVNRLCSYANGFGFSHQQRSMRCILCNSAEPIGWFGKAKHSIPIESKQINQHERICSFSVRYSHVYYVFGRKWSVIMPCFLCWL